MAGSREALRVLVATKVLLIVVLMLTKLSEALEEPPSCCLIRIPRRDGRVRHMDATGAYVSYRDSLGLAHLERHAWGSSYCSTPTRPTE